MHKDRCMYTYRTLYYLWSLTSQRTLTMFVGVAARRYVVLQMKCHNSHEHSKSPLTTFKPMLVWCIKKKASSAYSIFSLAN